MWFLTLMILTKVEPPHDKTNKVAVRPAKTQISLGTRKVWSESSLCAQWVAKDPSFLHADSEDSDQTGRMPRLIWVFAGRTTILLVLSRRGSVWQKLLLSDLFYYEACIMYDFVFIFLWKLRWWNTQSEIVRLFAMEMHLQLLSIKLGQVVLTALFSTLSHYCACYIACHSVYKQINCELFL